MCLCILDVSTFTMDEPINGILLSGSRMLGLIDTLHDQGPKSLSELAETTGMGRSTVHKYLKTLENHGYLINDSGVYSISYKFLDVGGQKRKSNDLYQACIQKLNKLERNIAGNISFAVMEKHKGVILHIGGRNYVHPSYVGTGFLLHTNSLGKAILADLSADQLNEVLNVHGLPKVTENTITDTSVLNEELETIRERGYATNRGERNPEIWAVATAVTHPEYDGLGAMSVSGSAHRFMTLDIESEVVPKLLEIKDELMLEFRSG